MPLAPLLTTLRAGAPLVHCISNIVSANDCANLALAVGASPIMAQAPQEMAEISAAASAVVLNTGTPSEEKFAACRAAGLAANAAGRPVVLDPVGVGASGWRLQQVRELLRAVRPSIVRVNYSEAAALLQGEAAERGVDSLPPEAPDRPAAAAAALAARLGTVVLLSGVGDVVAGGGACLCIGGGSARMRQVTGAGCMLSVLCGAFAAAAPATPAQAAAAASLFWKLCAQQAEQAVAGRGAGSFRTALFDAASTLAPAAMRAGEERLLTRL